jgi:hypothetical protein
LLGFVPKCVVAVSADDEHGPTEPWILDDFRARRQIGAELLTARPGAQRRTRIGST